MAETKIGKYSAQEKLNKMDVDLIDVTFTTVNAAVADNEVLADYVEIPNAVAVTGGSGIIQSIQLLDDADLGAAVDIVFQTDNTSLGTVNEAVSITDANAADILGYVSLSNYFDGVTWQMATKTNLGLVVKAASDSRSIYAAVVNRSGGNVTYAATDDLHLRIGIVKD